ncbi:MAG: F0F1 ATP synthase subunit A, partial [Planctomycetota bacterium]
KKNGFFHYMKANFLVGPPFLWPLMIPIEIMGHIIKPASLAIRLLANMVAGHLLLGVILSFAGFGAAIALISGTAGVLLTFLEILVAFIQAFIFTFLTTVYLGMAIHPDH